MKELINRDRQELAPLESERLANELRLTQDYWLELQTFIAGRKLRGAELSIARHAYENLLREADREADEWNWTDEGKLHPIPANARANWKDPLFLPPEPLYGDDLRAEVLAAIAAPMTARASTPWISCFPQFATKAYGLSPADAISVAHDLLIAAERYIEGLPKRPPTGSAEVVESFNTAFSTVTFDEIMASNRKGSGSIPLLPPMQQRRKGKSADEITGTQSLDAIRKAVREFLERERIQITEAEYKRNREQEDRLEKEGKLFRFSGGQRLTYQQWKCNEQSGIDDCMNNNRVSVMNLWKLRWVRFRDFASKQRHPASPKNDKHKSLR